MHLLQELHTYSRIGLRNHFSRRRRQNQIRFFFLQSDAINKCLDALTLDLKATKLLIAEHIASQVSE